MDGTTVLRQVAPAVSQVGTTLRGVTTGVAQALTLRYDPAALAEAEAHVLGHVTVPLTHRFVQAGPHQIHTLIAGEGPPLVMLHGHGGGVGVWYRNVEALARHFRLYAIDWLGWGRSDRPPFHGRSAESARDWWIHSLEDWRRAMGLERFYLLGHSLGGWIAVEYALAYGHHIHHLILANAAGLVDKVLIHKSAFYVVSPQRVIQHLGPFGPWLVRVGREAEAESCPCDGEALLDYYYQLSMAPLSGQRAFTRVLSLRRWNLPLVPRADRLDIPTTVIWGLHDDLFRIRHAHQFVERLPRGRLVPFYQSFHGPYMEEPGYFHSVVAGCLDEEAFPTD